MSRIGKLPIKVPADVNINWNGSELIVKGKFGTLQNIIPDVLQIEENNDQERGLGKYGRRLSPKIESSSEISKKKP